MTRSTPKRRPLRRSQRLFVLVAAACALACLTVDASPAGATTVTTNITNESSHVEVKQWSAAAGVCVRLTFYSSFDYRVRDQFDDVHFDRFFDQIHWKVRGVRVRTSSSCDDRVSHWVVTGTTTQRTRWSAEYCGLSMDRVLKVGGIPLGIDPFINAGCSTYGLTWRPQSDTTRTSNHAFSLDRDRFKINGTAERNGANTNKICFKIGYSVDVAGKGTGTVEGSARACLAH